MTITHQVHDSFKLFAGKLDAAGHIGDLAKQVSAWAASAKVAPKSIGIEFLEHSKQVIMSIGYRSDEASYGISIASTKIGKIEKLDAAELVKLEGALGNAADNQENVICHELYVTDANELYMVTMSHA
ncbi:MAG TPA: hypothetical protein VGG28_28245 [Kofleriaceae bacterium]|jgi:hypothetical protein